MSPANNPIFYLTRKTWQYSQGNRKNVVRYVFLFILANGIVLTEPLIIAALLNTVQQSGVTDQSLPWLLIYLALLFLLTPGFWLFHGPARLIENKNAFLARANYKKYLLSGVMALPPEWHTDHHSGDTIDKIEKGTKALFEYAGDSFDVVRPVVRLFFSYGVLVYFNAPAGLIVAVMVGLAFLLITQFDKVLNRQYKELYRAENKISEKIFDVVSNITTVIILRIEHLALSSIGQRIMEPFGLFNRNNKVNETKWFLTSLCSALMTILVLGSYLYGTISAGGTILIGTFYVLYGYLQSIDSVFFEFAYKYGTILQQKAAVMNAQELAHDFRQAPETQSFKLSPEWQELKIDSLNFSYHSEKGAVLHLDDISLTIEKGEKIALIGESGSGKTTFLKIIRELYRPQKVQVYLDSQLLPQGFSSLSADMALIPQEPEIFSSTISNPHF